MAQETLTDRLDQSWREFPAESALGWRRGAAGRRAHRSTQPIVRDFRKVIGAAAAGRRASSYSRFQRQVTLKVVTNSSWCAQKCALTHSRVLYRNGSSENFTRAVS